MTVHPMDFLGGQIREILSLQSEQEIKNMVPGAYGHWIYNPETHGGRWHIFLWKFCCDSFDPTIKPRRKIVADIVCTWNQCLLDIQASVERCRRQLALHASFDQIEKKFITTCHNEMMWDIKGIESRIQRLFILIKGFNPSATLSEDISCLIAQEANYSLIHVEEILGCTLPYEALQKKAISAGLNAAERAAWDDLLDRIAKGKLHIEELYKALQVIVDRNVDQLAQLCESMHKELIQKKCKIFEEEDAAYVKKTRALGPHVVCGSRTVTVGTKIPGRMEEGRHIVYSIAGSTDEVLVAGLCNPAWSLIEYQIAKDEMNKYTSHIRIAQIHAIDLNGTFIIEGIDSDKLGTYIWDKDSDRQRFQARQEALVNLVKKMSDHYMPAHLSPDMLRFNAQNELVFLRYEQNHGFDYNALVDFIVACTQGCPAVYREVIRNSGLANHPVTHFFHGMVSLAIRGEDLQLKEELERRDWGTHAEAIKSRANALKQEAHDLYDACENLIETSYVIPAEAHDDFKRILSGEIYIAIQNALGLMPKNLMVNKADIVHDVIQYYKPWLKNELLPAKIVDIRAYIGASSCTDEVIIAACRVYGVYKDDQVFEVKQALLV